MIDEPCEHEFNIDCEIVLGDLEMAFDGMRSRVFAQCYKCGLLLESFTIKEILEDWWRTCLDQIVLRGGHVVRPDDE